MSEKILNEWVCNYLYLGTIALHRSYEEHISTYPHFNEVVKNLREIYSNSWDIRLSSFLCLHPFPLPHRELPGPHTEKYFPHCLNVLLPDMYLWLVLIDHLTPWAWDWLFPQSLPTRFVSCTTYSGHLRRDQELDFYFLLVPLQQRSSYVSQHLCSHALMKLCVLWSKWLGSLEGNPKFRATVCVNWNAQPTLLKKL